MIRVLYEDWLWSSYNKCKLRVKKYSSNDLTLHQQKVADVFNTISDLSPVEIPKTNNDGNTENLVHHSIEIPNAMDNENDDNEDPEDALRILSNMKRYKINPLCSQNIVEIGWQKLGEKLEEDRRWSNMIQDQERLQIKEAVEYYIAKQKMRRNKMNLITTSSNKVMN